MVDLETLRTILASDPGVVELKFPREVVAGLMEQLAAAMDLSDEHRSDRDYWREQATTGMDALKAKYADDRAQLTWAISLINQVLPGVIDIATRDRVGTYPWGAWAVEFRTFLNRAPHDG